MLEYWGRVFRTAAHRTAWFSIRQLLASLITYLVAQYLTLLIAGNWNAFLTVALPGIGSYAVVILAVFLWNVGRAPYLLECERQDQIAQQNLRIAETTRRVGELEQQIAKPQPTAFDRNLLEQTAAKLKEFTPEEQRFLKHVLDNGEVHDAHLQIEGLEKARGSALEKGMRTNFLQTRTTHGDKYWTVNQHFRPFLSELFYPSAG